MWDAERRATRPVIGGGKYAQRTYSLNFSDEGIFKGKTVAQVAAELQSGEISPAEVPIQYIIRDGNTLILNTRSSQALVQAGIPTSQWNVVNMTGNPAAEARLTGQLARNGLTSEGVSEVTPEAPPVILDEER